MVLAEGEGPAAFPSSASRNCPGHPQPGADGTESHSRENSLSPPAQPRAPRVLGGGGLRRTHVLQGQQGGLTPLQ